MRIDIKLSKNFVTQYNKLQGEFGTDIARINGFDDAQLSYTDFIDNFIDESTVADASIDGNSNVTKKDIVTLLSEMPKPHRKLLAFNKIYYEIQKKYGFKAANTWLRMEWMGQLYMHDADTSTFKHYCFAYDLKDLAEKGLYFIDGTFNAKPPKHLEVFVDFVKENVQKPLQKHIITGSATDGTDSVEIAFQWGVKKETPYVFVNGLRCPELGTPVTGARAAITKTFNSLANENFDGEYIRKNLFYVINCKVENPSFANQTKTKINNPSLRTLATTAFTAALKEMNIKYNNEFNVISEMLKKVEKAEAAADKARNAVLNFEKKETEQKKQKITSSDKFKDCEKHGQDSMLIICEGNSALGGLMPARDVIKEALYAVRGKVKNLLKHPLDECLENQEVSDIIMALGCGIQNKYNSKKLNYGKVAIATDADVDGFSIMCLIATLFYVLMPKFIEEGRLCWLRAPLYRLTKGDKRVFAYDDKELEQMRIKYSGWEQGRNKGLGEMSADDMAASMMHPENRRLEVLTIHDIQAAHDSILMLMGQEVEGRRDFLFKNVDFSILNR